MKKILFSDLDGTLLKGLWISISDRLAIRKERKNGLLFIISTGRNFKSFSNFNVLERIKFDYAILGNGSQIIDGHKKSIHEVTFRTDMLLKALHVIVDTVQPEGTLEVIVSCHYKTKIYKNYKIEDDLKINKEFPDTISHCCIALKNVKESQEFIEQLVSNIGYLNIELNGQYIDITKKGVNKQYGVSTLIEYLGIDTLKTYAIGNSYNDVSMLKAVDFGFAVSTGTKEIRNIADMEVKSVAKCIEVIKEQE